MSSRFSHDVRRLHPATDAHSHGLGRGAGAVADALRCGIDGVLRLELCNPSGKLGGVRQRFRAGLCRCAGETGPELVSERGQFRQVAQLPQQRKKIDESENFLAGWIRRV